MVGKDDLKWLRENKFRKKRGELRWYVNVSDAKERNKSPFFMLDVVFNESTGDWHARVGVIKWCNDPMMVAMCEEGRRELGIPEEWTDNFWGNCPIGYATCRHTASDAVGMAVKRAARFTAFLLNSSCFCLYDLEKSFPLGTKNVK